MNPASFLSLEQAQALAEADPDARSRAMLRLAQAAATQGDGGRTAGLIQRAWDLAGPSQRQALLEAYRDFQLQVGNPARAKSAVLQVALEHARAGHLEACLSFAEVWQFAYPRWVGQDAYAYEPALLWAIQDLAAPHRLPSRLPKQAPGEPLRVAYLVFGGTHQNSVIVKIARIFAERHQGVTPAFFFPDQEPTLRQSLQGGAHLEAFRALGHRAEAAPAGPVPEGLLALGAAIQAFDPHVLVTTAALADFRHYFLASLFPHLPRVAQVSGPPPQFVPPDFDEGIAWTLHPLLDSPIPCQRVPLELGLPDPATVIPPPRPQLGIPEDATVLGAGGRSLKFRDPHFWRTVATLLRARPSVHFLAMGVGPGELGGVLPPLEPALAARLHFQPWQDDYLATLSVADVLLDTFPSGGGVVVQEMMALGRPVVAYANDYLKPFDQVAWTPAPEFLPPGDLGIPHGDEARYLEVVGRLVDDPAYRQAMGEEAQAWIYRHYDRPERMVRRCEQIYQQVYDRRRHAAS